MNYSIIFNNAPERLRPVYSQETVISSCSMLPSSPSISEVLKIVGTQLQSARNYKGQIQHTGKKCIHEDTLWQGSNHMYKSVWLRVQ